MNKILSPVLLSAVVLCIFQCSAFVAQAESAEAEASKGIASSLQPFVDNHTLAGAVTLVASRDKVLSLEAVGYADIAAQKPMQTNDLFWIASMSKAMTASALMMLVDEGKVNVDDPVEKYLPDFHGQMVVVEQDQNHELLKKPVHPITVKNILTHTSGLPFMSRAEHKIDQLTLHEAAISYALSPLRFQPDSKYDYSNAGINTAGRIVEVVSKMPYEEFMEKRLFQPLGMKDTTFWPNEEQLSRLAKSYRPGPHNMGLEETDISQLTSPLSDRKRGPSPAGGLFSTATDVSLFCRMLLQGGTLDGKRYLSEASIRQMTTTQDGDIQNHGHGEGGYGFGLSTSQMSHGPNDPPVVGKCSHGGAYSTDMSIDPEHGLVTVFMVQHAGYPGSDGGKILPAFKQAAVEAFGKKQNPTAEPARTSGVDRANFDTSVKPGQDFFQYVNGGWIKKNPIPPEYSRWGSFAALHDENLIQLRTIVEDLTKQTEPLDANRRKLRDFYHTAMDEAKLEEQGVKPLAGELQKIAAIQNRDDLVAELGHLSSRGLSTLFSFYVSEDEKQSIRYIAYLHQGGLGLPERDYYLGDTDYFKKLRTQYRDHVTRMLTLSGDSPETAAKAADAVMKIETQLAKASRSPVKLRDREAQYNLKARSELDALTPHLNWDLYLKPIEVANLSEAVVGQPEFFQAINEMLTSVPIEDWRSYLRWHLVHSTAAYLSDAIEQENFHFYGQRLRGAKTMQPRWKRAIGTLDGLMGEALGRLYVEKHFPPAAKERMDQLVKNVLVAYRERIEAVDWMGPQTKEQALAKLSTVMTKIGYPDKWRDYSSLEIGTGSYVENVLNARAFAEQYDLHKLGKRVDRTEWGMSPPTVNAYYNPTMNEIVFPAGILQPPFFDATADDAVNYGAIGAVIGHEITHGFDDQGSRSDADGNLKNWWTTEDRNRFNAKTDKLVKQYDACVALDDLHINGRLTLGENLADLGGVTISYAAYQRSLAGKAAPVIDGFTGPQRFFIGFAQVWRGESRDAELRVSLRTDPHSPPRFRTLVPLSNIQAFYDAFDIKPGDTMYRAPDDRVRVW